MGSTSSIVLEIRTVLAQECFRDEFGVAAAMEQLKDPAYQAIDRLLHTDAPFLAAPSQVRVQYIPTNVHVSKL